MNLPGIVANCLARRRGTARPSVPKRNGHRGLSVGALDGIAERVRPFGLTPEFRSKAFVFCGVHGIARHDISVLSRETFQRMQDDAAAGISPSARLANALGTPMELVRKTAQASSADFTKAAALNASECAESIMVGWRAVQRCSADVIGFGELGAGNTSSASALACALLGVKTADIVDTGSGISSKQLEIKRSVVERALNVHRSSIRGPIDALRRLGGHEIAAITGGILRCFVDDRVAVLDGFVTTAAALVACLVEPSVQSNLLCCCLSSERAHQVVCKRLGVVPFVDLGHTCGEGYGALLAIQLLHLALISCGSGQLVALRQR